MNAHREMTRKASMFLTLILTMASFRFARAKAADPIRLAPTGNHHLAEISAGQPYVAGFHVLSDDFRTYRQIDGATATVSFPSTNASSFPTGSWLGAGLFLQAQDHKYLFIDYGFYMIIALDFSGNLFVDVGLHQTMEGSLPIQQPDSRLIYAYTWLLLGIEHSTPITLIAKWNSEGLLNYSLRTEDTELFLMSIKVSELPNCENIMPHFYTGNVIGQQFPLGRYVDFFQFGVTGSGIIANDQWQALLENVKFLKQEAWVSLEKAWSIQGDISYLDQDATWGGAPYTGVDVQHISTFNQNGDALIFSYENRTLKPGMVLWDHSQASSNKSATQDLDFSQTFLAQFMLWSALSTMTPLKQTFDPSRNAIERARLSVIGARRRWRALPEKTIIKTTNDIT